MTYKFSQTADAPEWLWWAYGALVGGYALIKRGIAAIPQVAVKSIKEKTMWKTLNPIWQTLILILLIAGAVPTIYFCGYKSSAKKAEAEKAEVHCYLSGFSLGCRAALYRKAQSG